MSTGRLYIGDFVLIAHAISRQRQLDFPIAITSGNKTYYPPSSNDNSFGMRLNTQGQGRQQSQKEKRVEESLFISSKNTKRLKSSSSSFWSSGGSKQKILRLCYFELWTGEKQTEFAKFNAEDGHLLLTLLESDCEFEISIVSMPPVTQLMDDIIVNVQAYLYIPHYELSIAKNTTRATLNKATSSSELDEYEVHDVRTALIQLFTRIGLKCGTNNKQFSFDFTKVTSDDLNEDLKLNCDEVNEILVDSSARCSSTGQIIKCREGMYFKLRDYQEKALAFMYEREEMGQTSDNGISMSPLWEEIITPQGIPFYFSPYSGELSTEKQVTPSCRGGILADEMGLGKTIEMLALIHTRRPSVEATCPKDIPNDLTWIPSTLIVCPLNVLGQWKDEAARCLDKENEIAEMYYGDSRKNQAFNSSSATLPLIYLTTYQTLASEHTNFSSSPIYRHHWHRIVLDEGHYIREKTTKMTKACYDLSANHRWVITGTPIVNRLDDIYSLFRFLNLQPWNQFYIWKHFVSVPFDKKDPIALRRVHEVLNQVMIRRTKQMEDENGVPIIQLPEKTVTTRYLEFSSEERLIYDKLLRSSQLKLHWLKGFGKVDYSHVFQLLLRLRQMCIHPSLLPNFAKKMSGNEENVDQVPEFLELQSLIERNYGQSNKIFSELIVAELQSGETSIECPICFEDFQGGVLLPCLHRTCQQCILDYMDKRESQGEKGECPICRLECNAKDILQLVSSNDNGSNINNQIDKNDAKDGDDENSNKQKLLIRSASFKKSTKLLALENELQCTRDTDPRIKTVIFSQWTSVMDLIEVSLKDHGFKFVRLDGSMTQEKRQVSLDVFRDCPDTTVLLASLRSSGVGLNLTHASKLILFDPWWNASVEQQAIDRVHRIGQTKPVYVSRYIVKDSVEEKILTIQERKMKLLGMVTEDTKVTLEDLINLLK